MQNLINLLSQKSPLQKNQITNILKLLDEGSTIPFIARYRKEMTGGASDEVLRDFYELYVSVKRIPRRCHQRGAKDIVAERFLDNPKERKIVRDMTEKHGVLEVKKGKSL